MGSSVDTLAPGTELTNRYVIERVIGIGGMGAVYAARDQRFRTTERICAVKEMFDTFTDPETRKRAMENFEREANILASLSHRAIPKVFDFFTEGDRHYLVTEYVKGQDLAKVMKQRARPIAAEKAINWATQICDVLTYLHNQDPPVIFRDLKPSNIMLQPNEQITLIDFGIAKHFQISKKGTIIGTEGYAPPEQYEGEATPRVDIYALGATLHHLLTNKNPQEYRPFSFASRPIQKHNPAVPDALASAIMKALEDDPADRWQTAKDVQRALERHSTNGDRREDDTRSVTRPVTSLFDRLRGNDDSAGSSVEPATTVQNQQSGASSVTPLWQFKCEEEVRGTPTVIDNNVYVGSYDYNLYCLDAETGDFKWKFATKGGLTGKPAPWQHLIIVGSEDRRLYAINSRTGREAWTYATQGRIRSSPRVYQDSVIVGSDDCHVYSVDARSGNRQWKYEANGPVRSSACFHTQTACMGCEDSTLYALDTTSGQIRWRVRTNGPITSSPAIFEDRVICGSLDWVVYGVDVSSGWVIWRFRTNDRIISSPFVFDNRVVFGSVDGYIYCLDAEWGKQVWKHKLGEQITSSPYVVDGKVYCGSVDGALHCLEATHGRHLWSYQTDAPVPGSPTVADGVVFIGSMDHRVYALPADPQ